MSEVNKVGKMTVRVYGCGGAGTNLVTNVINIPTGSVGFPDMMYTVIDTSTSNIDKAALADKEISSFLVPGIDGSGKNRKYAYENSERSINDILVQNKPADFNIVIFSTSGGELKKAA